MATPTTSLPPIDIEARNFSIILGGPLFQLLRRAHITDDALHLLRRRVFFIALLAWLPLLLLSALAGDALGGAVAIPFVKDVQVHVRFLVAMPLLVVAELVVHMRLRPVAYEFLQRRLVPEEAIARFRGCVHAAMQLRNSVTAEIVMIVVIYVVGVPFVWRETSVLNVPTWYASAGEGSSGNLKLAGMWYAYVSVPLFQFLMLRWYFRIVIWIRFLWQVSRIHLNVSAMHGDRMGGLGFLSQTVFAFVPLAMAHGAVLSGTIANQIFFAGAKLQDSRYLIATVVAFLLVLVIAPLVVFAPQLAQAKRKAASVYGRLAQRYVGEFESRWLPGDVPAAESPLGTGDIQSLADLANSMESMRATRFVPITRDAVVMLVGATLLPVAPLLLTVVPAEEIAKQLIKMLL